MTTNNQKTETKKTKTYPAVIGTAELSEIISEKIGRAVEPKRVRTVLRTIINEEGYTKYRFNYPSAVVNRIVEKFVGLETERTDRKKLSAERKLKRSERKSTVITDVDESGKTKTESVKLKS